MVDVRGLVIAAVLVAGACGGGGESKVEAPWYVDGTGDEDGTVLFAQVGVGSSSCNELDSVEAIETDETIAIRAIVTRATGEDCTDDYEVVSVEVPLDEPWGDRELIDCRPDGPLTDAFEGPQTVDPDQCVGM